MGLPMLDEINLIHARERAARRLANDTTCPRTRAVHLASADRHAEAAWALLNRLLK